MRNVGEVDKKTAGVWVTSPWFLQGIADANAGRPHDDGIDPTKALVYESGRCFAALHPNQEMVTPDGTIYRQAFENFRRAVVAKLILV